jgi:hypothetical protein
MQQNDRLPGWIPDIRVPDFQEVRLNALDFEHGINSTAAVVVISYRISSGGMSAA